MSRFGCGLIVGKLAPLHLGHERLIRVARERCERLVLLSYTKPEFQGCGPAARLHWLRARFPDVEAYVLDDGQLAALGLGSSLPHNDADELVHRDLVARFCRVSGIEPDAVFTGESYGEGFAHYLSTFFGSRPVVHVMVDRSREPVSMSGPISASLIRRDVPSARSFLSPEVYASFVRRVAVVGGESSGKSTLVEALGRAFATSSAAEFGRELWIARNGMLRFDDMLHIAEVQVDREEHAAAHGRGYVFCDTTPLTTCFYSEDLFGRSDPRLVELSARPYDLIVLAAPDFPFVQDGTRRDARYRARQHERYLERLGSSASLWLLVGGSVDDRLRAVEEYLRTHVPVIRALGVEPHV